MHRPTSPHGYLVVSLCYQGFTLSDGALRMLVLLHLHATGCSPWQLALLLVPYEVAGVATNLAGGWLAARLGQKPVLLFGLLLQASACLMLAADPAALTVAYVMLTQVLSGVAKDLVKTAAKSYVRVLAPTAAASTLFGLVASMTGSKNATKGLGFFLGGALLATAGFAGTNLGLALGLVALLGLAAYYLPRSPGQPGVRFASLFAHDATVNWLATARLFLFGSRDAWFAVALPLFLTSTWGWGPAAVGGMLSCWVIGYGAVQALTPRLLPTTGLPAGMRCALACTAGLLLPLAVTWSGLQEGVPEVLVLLGLFAFGIVFALCSSLHSWLVVAAAGGENVAQRVGFYYAANAVGRLLGTMLSGALFGMFATADTGHGARGLAATLLAAACAVGVSAVTMLGALRACRPTPGSSQSHRT